MLLVTFCCEVALFFCFSFCLFSVGRRVYNTRFLATSSPSKTDGRRRRKEEEKKRKQSKADERKKRQREGQGRQGQHQVKTDLDSASDCPTKSKLKPGLRNKNKDLYTVWDTF